MTERRNVRVTIHSSEDWDEGFPAGDGTKLVDLLSWMRKMLNSIPPGYRDVATCEISPSHRFDEPSRATIEIGYCRPETDAEMAGRADTEERMLEARRRQQQENDLSLLRDLKSKYPDA